MYFDEFEEELQAVVPEPDNPDYEELAGRLIINNHHKKTNDCNRFEGNIRCQATIAFQTQTKER